MGIFDFICKPLGFIFRFMYSWTDNYLVTILLFTLAMEILLCPIAIKQQKNQIKQARLAPKASAIRKKYAGRTDQATQQKMQQETLEMYQQENFNPMGGCLPLLIQFPFILAIYNVVTQPLRYLCNVPSEQITALQNALTDAGNTISLRNAQLDIINIIRGHESEYYGIAESLKDAVAGNRIPSFTLFGIDLSVTPSSVFDNFTFTNKLNLLVLIPIATFFVMVFSTKLMQKFSYRDPAMEEQQNSISNKLMMWSMPLLSVFIEFQLASLIGIYWIFRNIVQLAEKLLLAKVMPLPKITKEEFDEAERQINMSNKQRKREALAGKSGDRPFVRSLHHIDDEEYIARHAEELKALEEEKEALANRTPKFGLGKLTSSKDAPVPIKNDEKASYEAKSDDKTDKNENKKETK